MNGRLVACIRCAYCVPWEQHSAMVAPVDCPQCGTAAQFGPGVYVPEFKGYKFEEVQRFRACKAEPYGTARAMLGVRV